MECQTINGLVFSYASKQAIKEIRRVEGLSSALLTITGVGTFANIFLANKVIEASYSLSTTDFKMMTKGMTAIPLMKRSIIERIAGLTALRVSTREERLFWKTIYLGCKGGE